MRTIRVALVGAGAMARLHARTLAANPRVELAVVIDRDPARAQALAARYTARWSTDARDAEACDAAIVAVATEAHVAVALPLLAAGLAVLVEKPVSVDLANTISLIEASRRHDRPLQCGLVERFNPAVAAVRRLAGGPASRVEAIRHGGPPARAHAGVVHDLLLHDIDLTAILLGSARLKKVLDASAGTVARSPWPERVDCTLAFEGGAIASLSASRLSEHRERRLTLSYDDRIVEVDLLRQEVSSTGGPGMLGARYFAGDALAAQLEHFADLVEGRIDADAERESIRVAHRIADEVASAIEASLAAQRGAA